MSVLQKVKSILPVDDDGIERRTYNCQNCGNTFESAKTPDRAQCMECMSHDIERQ
jgi:predicted Zn-ribbon and HTH transcriptional regulator